MRSRFQPLCNIKKHHNKKKPQSDTQQPDTQADQVSHVSQPDPQIQYSNSQLTKTLSTTYSPKQFYGREHQKQVIERFIKDCLKSQGQQNSRVLYISGVPGIGKTASTMQIINKIKKTINYRKAAFKYINAMSLMTPGQIYKTMNRELFKADKDDIKKNPPLMLMTKLQQDKRMKFVIIDQIDYLYTKNQNILYNLFEWCNMPDTKLCAIIIANTMDFPERLQPKITSRMGSKRLTFKPYSHLDAQRIVQQRLMKSNRFSKDAVQYACKKMTSFTSDVRKLLDILRKALQLKNEGVITLEDMNRTWKKFAEETGQLWLQSIPDCYKQIMAIIKDHGAVSNNYRIYDRLNVKNKHNIMQINIMLKQMEQMGIVRLKDKKQKCLKICQVTLLKM